MPATDRKNEKVYRLYVNPKRHPALYELLESMSPATRGFFIREACEALIAKMSSNNTAPAAQPAERTVINPYFTIASAMGTTGAHRGEQGRIGENRGEH
jgi:hypothetical protein